MPKVENLNQAPRVVNAVIDDNRRMHKLPDGREAFDRCTYVWKPRKKIGVIQQSVAELLRGVGEVRPGIGQDLFKVRQRGV
jgi:hypothetical protein